MALPIRIALFFLAIIKVSYTTTERTIDDYKRIKRQNLYASEKRGMEIEHDILNQDSVQRYWNKVRKEVGDEPLRKLSSEEEAALASIYGDSNFEQVRRRRTSQLHSSQERRRSFSEASRRNKLNSQRRQNRLNQPHQRRKHRHH